MTKLNVVDLVAFKELKELKRSVASFEKYLKSLSHMQLQVEVNCLIDEPTQSNPSTGGSFFSKSQMIIKEISSRVHPTVRPKIEELRTDI